MIRTRALLIVTGYFGERLAQMLARYGADVQRLDVEWGRAVDPARGEDWRTLAGAGERGDRDGVCGPGLRCDDSDRCARRRLAGAAFCGDLAPAARARRRR